ncbi:hypothetical protein Micbo1qcDRAFT_201398 [Microdochium bolleyi]|uniref:Zn(2)-C6 fungal-type domain-containing protein n=1 Tax=Microdochium bolleyi TaxID=196109 RepID=A0A136JFX6_9PEZI|nr:hypothetical protein Micbo1qcDRAFT_201398 [Microdochium bolleyi]
MSKRPRPEESAPLGEAWPEEGSAEAESSTRIATTSPNPRRSVRRSYGPQGGRRKGTACVRCRIQKIRCDDAEPACTNCVKAGHSCLRARGNPELDSYVQELEGKVKHLERQLAQSQTQTSPTSGRGDIQGLTSTAVSSPASTQINPSEQPLAHNVGLLSLANSREPKYLGPSSGVVFGRLVFAAAPATQGLSTADNTHRRCKSVARAPRERATQEPSIEDLLYFAEAYFEIYQPLYPFLDPAAIFETVEHMSNNTDENIDLTTSGTSSFCPPPPPFNTESLITCLHRTQALLVAALGSRALESRLRTDFGAETLYTRAVAHLEHIPNILETVRGVQVLLLLTLASFSFPGGYNAWFLTSTIIASCLDLGLQRRRPGGSGEPGGGGDDGSGTGDVHGNDASRGEMSDATLRSGIFWSAYSLDRALCVVLGRPLTLRDEALDADFPDGSRSHDDDINYTPAGEGEVAVTPGRFIRSSIAPQIMAHGDPGLQTPATSHNAEAVRSPKHMSMPAGDRPYAAACLSFRLDQITAETKLMLHRVSQSPRRFPWPTDFPTWQGEVQRACEHILGEIQSTFRGSSSRSRSRSRPAGMTTLTHERTTQQLELKYHACMMLLHRPSPAIPHPTGTSMTRCYVSSRATIGIYASMHRFGNLPDTWLTAHAVFVSGITMLYCLWTRRKKKKKGSDDPTDGQGGEGEAGDWQGVDWEGVGFEEVRKDCESCVRLLRALGETWSVAEDAMEKFERLVLLTERSWDNLQNGHGGGAQGSGDGLQPQQESLPQSGDAPAFEFGPSGGSQFDLDLTGNGGNAGADDFSDLFLGELGDMSTWFDLSWLNETEALPVYPDI